MQVTRQIKKDFDYSFKFVKKRGVDVPFSSEIILSEFYDAGIPFFDAIDLLYDMRESLFEGITTKQILKIMNAKIISAGYDEQSLIKIETTQVITVTYNNEIHELGFKILKTIVREKLEKMKYTSKTFRDLIDEFHRNLLGLDETKISNEDVDKLLPVSLRNIIGTNPFSPDRSVEDYEKVVKLQLSIQKTWIALPLDERLFILNNFIEAAFRIILLSFNYLPGHILSSIMVQMNNVLTDLSSKADSTLSDTEVVAIQRTISHLNPLLKEPLIEEILDIKIWQEEIEILTNLCTNLISSSSIRWIVGRDKFGRDLFSFSSLSHKQTDGISTELISSAIYGIEAQLNEITKSRVKLLDQGENAIIINKKDSFTLISLIEKPIPNLINQKLETLGDFIASEMALEIENFMGNVTPFQRNVGNYLKKNFSEIFVGEW